MKRIFSMAIAFFMIFAMTSCAGKPTPTDVTKEFFDGAKNEAKKSVEEFSKGSDAEILKDLGISAEDAKKLDKETTESIKKVFTMMADFEYEVMGEEISKDKKHAVVTVNVKAYNLGLNFTDGITNVMSELTAMAFSGKSETEMINHTIGSLFKKMADSKKSYTKVVKIHLDYGEDGWKVNENNNCLLYTSPSPRDGLLSRMPSSA